VGGGVPHRQRHYSKEVPSPSGGCPPLSPESVTMTGVQVQVLETMECVSIERTERSREEEKRQNSQVAFVSPAPSDIEMLLE